MDALSKLFAISIGGISATPVKTSFEPAFELSLISRFRAQSMLVHEIHSSKPLITTSPLILGTLSNSTESCLNSFQETVDL